jgi:hypothetical protein
MMQAEAESTEATTAEPLVVESSHRPKFGTQNAYTGEIPLGLNPWEDEMAALRFIINEQKAQLHHGKQVLEWCKEEADASSHRRANLSAYYSSSAA